jgi:serine/threonine protein kinase
LSIFHLILKSPESIDSNIDSKVSNLLDLITKMKSSYERTRPKVEDILREREKWCLKFNEIENEFKEFGRKFSNCNEKLFPILYRRFEEKREIHKCLIEKNLLNDKYEKEFEEKKFIGSGGFGAVFRVENKKNKSLYAIKKFAVNEKNIEKSCKETDLMKALNCNYIPKYIDSWIEINKRDHSENSGISSTHKMFDPQFTHLLYFQMELCFETIKQTKEKFDKPINVVQYFILSQLVIELFECLDYLHNKFKPPIIHRDLKPANILISYGLNGRFVKIADFGLSTFHEFEEQTHSQGCGTKGYMAPEVINSRKYDTKADIHSLKETVKQIFDA